MLLLRLALASLLTAGTMGSFVAADSGGLRFQWVDDPTHTSEGISLRASSTAGQTLTIRQI